MTSSTTDKANQSGSLRLLIIDDSKMDAELLEDALVMAGYEVKSQRVWNEKTMQEALIQGAWDLALLDFSMPEFTPHAALAIWKKAQPEAPLIIVSGEVSTEDVVVLLKAGASDFIKKDDLARLALAVKRGLKEAEERRTLARHKQELSVSEAYNRFLFETSPIGLALCRMDGKLVDVNPAYAEIIGRTVKETLALSYWDITPKKYADQEHEQLDSLKATGRYGPYEKEYIHRDGHLVPVRLSGLIVQRQGADYIWSTVEDITDRKRTEKELEKHQFRLQELVDKRTRDIEEKTIELKRSQTALQYLLEDVNEAKKELEAANKRLKELDRLKSMFIASMSHELRTPLNSIIGFSGLILGNMAGEISDEQRDMMARVSRAGKHLLSLITDVIDIAKIESGKIVPYPEDFLLGDLVNEAVAQVEAQSAEKGLVIEQHVPEEPIPMHLDRRRLLQCLLNYLSNAIKFSEKGTVSVVVIQGAQDGKRIVPEGWVEISVSDTGIGIREEDMKLLFSSFVRLDTPLKTTTPGTGLGLYLTKKLSTEVLGGTVGAESKEGHGSRFWIRIPQRIEAGTELLEQG